MYAQHIHVRSLALSLLCMCLPLAGGVFRYTFCVKVPHLAGTDPYTSDLAPNPPQLYFCALSYGNLTCLANDPCLDPLAVARSHISQGKPGDGGSSDLAAAAGALWEAG